MLNTAHVIEIKAKNSLVIRCQLKKAGDGENLFFKALANRF